MFDTEAELIDAMGRSVRDESAAIACRLAAVGELYARRFVEWADRELWCRAANLPCSHCRQPIDYDAPANSPNAFESDHRLPVSTRPDLAYVASNLIPSCSRCNRSRGTKPMHDPGAWVVADW